MPVQFDQRTHTMIRPRRLTDEVKSSSFRATVPFSWEKKPGTSKLKPYSSDRHSLDHYFTTTTSSLKLTPPSAHLSPQISTRSTAGHWQSHRGSFLCSTSFRSPGGASPTTAKNNRLQEDPFLAAFIKCTQMHDSKITNSGRRYSADNKHDAAARFSARKKNTWFLRLISTFSSCKYSSAVRDDSSDCRNNAKFSRYLETCVDQMP